MQFSKLIQKIKPSATVEINSIAQNKKAAGERIFNLSAGEPIIDPIEIMQEAGIKAIKEGKFRYPPVAGLPELREESVKWHNRLYGTSFNSNNIVITAGGKFEIYALCQTILNPKDKVLIITPFWVSYSDIVELFGGVAKIIKTNYENKWKVSVEDLEKNYSKKTKMLILNNASNPTGTIYTGNELREILKWAASKDILVISDEVYSGLVYRENKFISLGSFPEYKDNVVIIQSCSKSFSMTGWRIGMMFANEEIIKKIIILQSQSTSGAPTVGQWVALEAIRNADMIMNNIKNQMEERMKFFIDKFNLLFDADLEYIDSALYAFVPMSKISKKYGEDSIKFAKELLEKVNIATVPGEAFGQDGYLRFSFGERVAELELAINALYNYVQ